jgi:hypothetical protein
MIVFPSRKAPAVSLGGGGGGYSAEAQQFFDRISDPGTQRKDLYAALIDSLVANGIWSKLDLLYVFAAGVAATALTNLRQSSYGATAVNSPTFTVDRGYQGDGSTSYINSNFNPAAASSPQISQNSSCAFVWVLTNGQSASDAIGQATAGNIRIRPRNTFDNQNFQITGGVSANLTNTTDSRGFLSANRPDANNHQFYKNGASAHSAAIASSALTSANITFFKNGSGFDGAHQLAVGGCGASLTATEQSNLYSALLTYLQGVGAA